MHSEPAASAPDLDLLSASRSGDLALLADSFRRGARTDLARDAEGKFALHLAASFGRDLAVGMLLGTGASLEIRSPAGLTPLLCACELGQLPCAQILLARGACIFACDARGRTALSLAAERADFFESFLFALSLLNLGADPFSRDEHGRSPLSIARAGGNALLADAMLASTALFELRTLDEWAPVSANFHEHTADARSGRL